MSIGDEKIIVIRPSQMRQLGDPPIRTPANAWGTTSYGLAEKFVQLVSRFCRFLFIQESLGYIEHGV
jgi:hypothetical protein